MGSHLWDITVSARNTAETRIDGLGRMGFTAEKLKSILG